MWTMTEDYPATSMAAVIGIMRKMEGDGWAVRLVTVLPHSECVSDQFDWLVVYERAQG